MTKEDLQEAARTYKSKGVGSKYDFIAGAQFVLDQQAKDVEELRKEFEDHWLKYTEDEDITIKSVFDWFLNNIYKKI